MDVNAYLDRIQYSGPFDTTLATLRKLNYQHQLAIPIENLDIHRGREIVLEPDALFTKIITHKRGGFCYELNGLFYELLKTLGFQVKRISGRVYDVGNGFNAEFDHLAIVARIDGIDWLVDVAFGRRFSLYPLLLERNQIQEDKTGRYRITEYDANYLAVSQQHEDGSWEPGYIFTLIPRQLSDFSEMCHFHQTSDDSYFTQNKLCSLVTPGGRITLTDDKLKITHNGQATEFLVTNDREFGYYLDKYFGIRVDARPKRIGQL
ncbi:arylamine N-acetyltransferase [Spirosoma jeollabukense]